MLNLSDAKTAPEAEVHPSAELPFVVRPGFLTDASLHAFSALGEPRF